jgi:hypothetical protein
MRLAHRLQLGWEIVNKIIPRGERAKIGKDPSGVVSGGGLQPFWGDFNDASGGECSVLFSKRFAAPENGNGVFR